VGGGGGGGWGGGGGGGGGGGAGVVGSTKNCSGENIVPEISSG